MFLSRLFINFSEKTHNDVVDERKKRRAVGLTAVLNGHGGGRVVLVALAANAGGDCAGTGTGDAAEHEVSADLGDGAGASVAHVDEAVSQADGDGGGDDVGDVGDGDGRGAGNGGGSARGDGDAGGLGSRVEGAGGALGSGPAVGALLVAGTKVGLGVVPVLVLGAVGGEGEDVVLVESRISSAETKSVGSVETRELGAPLAVGASWAHAGPDGGQGVARAVAAPSLNSKGHAVDDVPWSCVETVGLGGALPGDDVPIMKLVDRAGAVALSGAAGASDELPDVEAGVASLCAGVGVGLASHKKVTANRRGAGRGVPGDLVGGSGFVLVDGAVAALGPAGDGGGIGGGGTTGAVARIAAVASVGAGAVVTDAGLDAVGVGARLGGDLGSSKGRKGQTKQSNQGDSEHFFSSFVYKKENFSVLPPFTFFCVFVFLEKKQKKKKRENHLLLFFISFEKPPLITTCYMFAWLGCINLQ